MGATPCSKFTTHARYMPTKGPIADGIAYLTGSSPAAEPTDEPAAEGDHHTAAPAANDGVAMEDAEDTASADVAAEARGSAEEEEAAAAVEEDAETPFETWALRIGFCAVSTCVAAAMLSFGFIVPRRYTHTMTVLKDAKTVRIGTYQIVGERSFEVPISALSFQHKHSPDPLDKISTYQIEGHSHFYLMEGRKGFYPNKPLFHWMLHRTSDVDPANL